MTGQVFLLFCFMMPIPAAVQRILVALSYLFIYYYSLQDSQVTLAALRPKRSRAKAAQQSIFRVRLLWEYLHSFTGHVAVLAGLINCITGVACFCILTNSRASLWSTWIPGAIAVLAMLLYANSRVPGTKSGIGSGSGSSGSLLLLHDSSKKGPHGIHSSIP